MVLLIDIGNSRVKWVVSKADIFTHSALMSHHEACTTGFGFSTLQTPPQAIYFINVAGGEVEQALFEVCRERWGITPQRLQSQESCCGVVSAYNDAGSLGVDRWAAIVGAYSLVKEAVLVLDCGTACTADFISRDGYHLGGAIVPGASTMLRYLQQSTNEISVPATPIGRESPGRTTQECIEYGITQSLHGFIERMVLHAEQSLDGGFQVLMTGGDAEWLRAGLDCGIKHEKELLFHGMLAMIAATGNSGVL